MDGLIGQPVAVDLLKRQLASGRLHHAYIFHGPSGVGKMTCALAFAAAWLCQDRADGMACGRCASCASLADPIRNASGIPLDEEGLISLNHPDLHLVTKELARYHKEKRIRDHKLSNIPVDVVREHLIQQASMTPTLGARKAFIVDEAELMQAESQNAILKTLEEPTPGTLLILVTAVEDRLLPTVRSRCQRIAFVPLTDADVRDYIAGEAPDLSAARVDRLAELADGSFGRARIALDYNLVDWVDAIGDGLEQIDQGRAQPELGAMIHQSIDDFAAEWVKKHAGASKLAANRLGLNLMATLIAGRARRRLMEVAPTLDADDPIDADAQVAGMLGTIDAVEYWTGLVRSNVNLTLACDHLVMRLERSAVASA
ncbi:DNA polymerase III subunit [Mucisphaera calidilacus]|nr:DNA polymerase III subunit [Mucisphaera calidilacus]